MRLPRVDPVGVVEHPPDYSAAPRGYPAGLRLAALAILGAFGCVNVATTVYSLGVYCLTSWASVPFSFSP